MLALFWAHNVCFVHVQVYLDSFNLFLPFCRHAIVFTSYYSSWLCLLKGGAFEKTKVGPLLGVMQRKSTFKVHFKISKNFMLLAYHPKAHESWSLLALDPSYPIKKIVHLQMCCNVYNTKEFKFKVQKNKTYM